MIETKVEMKDNKRKFNYRFFLTVRIILYDYHRLKLCYLLDF